MSLAAYQQPTSRLTARAFSSAQSSSAEEATPATPFAHKVDEHVEEQKRRRLSDVSTVPVLYYPKDNGQSVSDKTNTAS
jgi:hypothetical protein